MEDFQMVAAAAVVVARRDFRTVQNDKVDTCRRANSPCCCARPFLEVDSFS